MLASLVCAMPEHTKAWVHVLRTSFSCYVGTLQDYHPIELAVVEGLIYFRLKG